MKHLALLFLIIVNFSLFASEMKTVPLKVGSETFWVEVATTAEEQATGLMNRSFLPNNKGMLFKFEKDSILSFWMKNTSIKLSIAYIDSMGRIIDIIDMIPYSTKTVRSSGYARYALELNQGAFAKAGVKVGDTITNLPR